VVSFFFCIVHTLERSFFFRSIFSSPIARGLHVRSYISFVYVTGWQDFVFAFAEGIHPLRIGMSIT